MQVLEMLAVASMCLVLAISWPGAGHEHWWTILAYAGLLVFHGTEYRKGLHATRVLES
jgi:hypothetical protein